MEKFIIALSLVIVYITLGIFTVKEGHLGLIYRGNALLNYTKNPGYNLKIPIIDTIEQVDIRTQTDMVTDIPCGTKGGTMLKFAKIEVVNILSANSVLDTVRSYGVNYAQPLIYSKVHHLLNQWCSKRTLNEVYIEKFDEIDDFLQSELQENINNFQPNLRIIAVRVTKPIVPKEIMINFQALEEQKTAQKVAEQTQKVKMKEAETLKLIAMEKATQEARVSEINNLRNLETARTEQDIKRMNAEAEYYKKVKEAEANNKLNTKDYRDLKKIESISSNTKIYFGDIPKMFPYSFNQNFEEDR